jgi:tetratricopeptide (TPR) repeat protein
MGTVEPGGIQAANGEMAAVAGGTAERLSGTGMFGEELKAQRVKRGWTQVELGRKLDRYSDSYISDIERGAKPPTMDFARKCDQLFDLPGTFERLYQIVKRAEEYPAWFESVVVPFEVKASRINGWELGTMPGLLQTEDYARALIRVSRHDAPDEEVERLVAARPEGAHMAIRRLKLPAVTRRGAGYFLTDRGTGHFLTDRYEEALAEFTKALDLDPGNVRAIGNRAITYQEMGRYDDLPWVIAWRGETYTQLERYDEAVADLNRAIELDPSLDWAIAARGLAYLAMKRYHEALEDLGHALERDPDNAWAIARRGETYRLMGRYDEALAEFSRALQSDPEDAWATGSRGQAFLALERYDEALADLNSAIEIDPSRDWAIAARGETYRQMVRYDDALADLSRAIELDPADATYYAARGQAYQATGRDSEASADFRRANEIDPSYQPPARLRFGLMPEAGWRVAASTVPLRAT